MLKEVKRTWTCPEGSTWKLCDSILEQTHTMIGGTTGSGKSTLLHSIMWSALKHSPARYQFVLIDLKGVELRRYRNLPHTIAYADEPSSAINAIELVEQIMKMRLEDLKAHDQTMYQGNEIYLIIDEMAVLMQLAKAKVLGPLANIMRLGRATRVHVITATQNPSRTRGGGAPSEIAQNVTSCVALRCRSAIESRSIIGIGSAENLPKYGEGLFWNENGINRVSIPMTSERDIQERIDYWMTAVPKEEKKFRWFSR